MVSCVKILYSLMSFHSLCCLLFPCMKNYLHVLLMHLFHTFISLYGLFLCLEYLSWNIICNITWNILSLDNFYWLFKFRHFIPQRGSQSSQFELCPLLCSPFENLFISPIELYYLWKFLLPHSDFHEAGTLPSTPQWLLFVLRIDSEILKMTNKALSNSHVLPSWGLCGWCSSSLEWPLLRHWHKCSSSLLAGTHTVYALNNTLSGKTSQTLKLDYLSHSYSPDISFLLFLHVSFVIIYFADYLINACLSPGGLTSLLARFVFISLFLLPLMLCTLPGIQNIQ